MGSKASNGIIHVCKQNERKKEYKNATGFNACYATTVDMRPAWNKELLTLKNWKDLLNASLFNDAITHVVKTRRIFDAPEKSDMMLNRIKDEYRYRTSNDTNFINV